MQLYLHDLSSYQNTSLDDDGRFRLGRYFDAYWNEAGRYPFLIFVGGEIAGFAFVRKTNQQVHAVAEFFIIRRFRELGVGTQAARALFTRFKGQWQITEMENNLTAQLFWRTVIKNYTDDQFEECWSETEPTGPMQVFRNDG